MRLEALLLRRINERTQLQAAKAMGVSVSTMAGIYAGRKGVTLARLEPFLESLGLQVVDAGHGGDTVTLPAEEYHALRTLARKGLLDGVDA